MAAKGDKPDKGAKGDKRTRSDSAGEGDRPARGRNAPIGSYDDWTVPELRRRAKELGLTGYAGKGKSALVALLRRH